MEINTTIMRHVLRMSESFAEVLAELRQVKKELAELKRERENEVTASKTKYSHMKIISYDR